MEQQQLHEQLDQLSNAIAGMQASDEDKNKLGDLIVDIERQLIDPMIEQGSQSLVKQVDGMVSGFERDHPTVAGILNNIMVALTSMGV